MKQTVKTPTFRQLAVLANAYLNTIDDALPETVRMFADENALEHFAYYRRNKNELRGHCICMDCGTEFDADRRDMIAPQDASAIDKCQIVCPHCGRVLYIVPSRKMQYDKYRYFGREQMVNGIRVVRVYECHDYRKRHKDSGDFTRWSSWNEILRVWHDPNDDNNHEITSCYLQSFPYSRRSPWIAGSHIDYHAAKNPYYDNHAGYEYEYWAPKIVCQLEEPLQFDAEHSFITSWALTDTKSWHHWGRVMERVFKTPLLETMANVGYYAEARWIANCSDSRLNRNFDNLMTAIRICMRHQYHPEDMDMYLDYLEELVLMRRDIHNAHYVCPADFRAAHAQTSAQAERWRIKHMDEAERRLVEQAEPNYYRDKHTYFGVVFGEDQEHLQFHVIGSVAEMKEEGKAMHHCVGGYHTHQDALIISCRDCKNNRVATVEVNLRTLEIVQTRGVCNAVPEHKELINATIRQNMHLIRDAREQARLEQSLVIMKTPVTEPAAAQEPAAPVEQDLQLRLAM